MGKTGQLVNLHCSSPKCEDCISLSSTSTQHSSLDSHGTLAVALEAAATLLGWRRDITPIGPLYRDRDDLRPTSPIYCPKHAAKLVCARCGERECFCMGGPRFDARQA